MKSPHRSTLVVAVVLAMGATACSRSEAPAEDQAAAAILGPGDAERGRRVFGSCRSCHAVETGVNRVGPSLFGVVGRRAGAVADYTYSNAMAESGLFWDQATLEAYLENPRTHVPGTKMSFAGVSDPQARRDVVAYLATLK